MAVKKPDRPQKPIYKKWWFWVIIALVLAAIGSSANGGDGKDKAPSSSVAESSSTQESTVTPTVAPTPTNTPSPTKAPETSSQSTTKEPERYTLPDSGLEINFQTSVRNDVTGNWRLATTSDSIVPAECAVEYYKTMFSSDDEIHGIWNATLGTMTSISVGSGMLFVDTYEYVNGEEHDAKLMFSGNKLMSEVFDLSTGQPLDD